MFYTRYTRLGCLEFALTLDTNVFGLGFDYGYGALDVYVGPFRFVIARAI